MKGLLWIACVLFGLSALDQLSRDPMPLAIDATPAQFVDNCGRFHPGPDLLRVPDPTFPGTVQQSRDKGIT